MMKSALHSMTEFFAEVVNKMDANRAMLLVVAALCAGVLVYLVLRKRKDAFEGFMTSENGVGDFFPFKAYSTFFLDMHKEIDRFEVDFRNSPVVNYTVEQKYAMMHNATESLVSMDTGPSLITQDGIFQEMASFSLNRNSSKGGQEPWVPTFKATIEKCKTLKKLFTDNEQASNNQTAKYYVTELAKSMFVELVNSHELTVGLVDYTKPVNLKTTVSIEVAGDTSGSKISVPLLDVDALIATPLATYLANAGNYWARLVDLFNNYTNSILSGVGPDFRDVKTIKQMLYQVEVAKIVAIHYVVMLTRLNADLSKIISVFDLIKPGSNLSKTPMMTNLFNSAGTRTKY